MIIKYLEEWKRTTLFYKIQVIILFVMTAITNGHPIILGYLFVLTIILMVNLYEVRNMSFEKIKK